MAGTASAHPTHRPGKHTRRLLHLLVWSAVAWACAEGEDPPVDPPVPVPSPRAEAGAEPAPNRGLWKRARVRSSDADLSEPEREMVRHLETLGYVAGSQSATGLKSVTRNLQGRVAPGLNFLTSGHAPEALLMNDRGDILHRWHGAFRSLFPNSDRPAPSYWRRAHLFPNGDVIAIFGGQGMARLDSRSRVIWTSALQAHHDLDIAANGDVYVLTRQINRVEGIHSGQPFGEDFVTVLDAEGRMKRNISLVEALYRSPYSSLFDPSKSVFGDLLHTNSVALLDGRLSDRIPEFESGRVLVSFLVPSLIAVVDMEEGRVVWAHRGSFRNQHDPNVLDNGNLLLFDNLGDPHSSLVREFDPASGHSVWTYRGSEAEPFRSATCGAAQRLGNGNTLITESDAGRAFEVDERGEIVWEFHNPHRAGEEGEFVAALLEVRRLPESFPSDWIDPETVGHRRGAARRQEP